MPHKKKITLSKAILININIIAGAGIFINPSPITKFVGQFGFLGYLISILILLPIVLSIAELAKNKPTAGGLYVYSKEYINPMAGFICSWGYFLGKATSSALLAHLFVVFLQTGIPWLQNFPVLFLDCLLISSLILLNIVGIHIGGKIQYFITAFKIIPITFVILVGLAFFNPQFLNFQTTNLSNMVSILPITIFALLSFEIICSIGHLIEKPEKNILKAILFPFLIVGLIATIFQFLIYSSVGPSLARTFTPIGMFASQAFPMIKFLPKLLNIFIFSSILGGVFGTLSSNSWNLHTLAKNKHLPFAKFLTKVSKKHVPWASLITQGALACLILAINKNQIPLQNMVVLGVAIAYLLSSFSALIHSKGAKFHKSIPFLAIISSGYIIGICLKNLYLFGVSFSFLIIFSTGLGLAVWKKYVK